MPDRGTGKGKGDPMFFLLIIADQFQLAGELKKGFISVGVIAVRYWNLGRGRKEKRGGSGIGSTAGL